MKKILGGTIVVLIGLLVSCADKVDISKYAPEQKLAYNKCMSLENMQAVIKCSHPMGGEAKKIDESYSKEKACNIVAEITKSELDKFKAENKNATKEQIITELRAILETFLSDNEEIKL